MSNKILDALGKLDIGNDEHWTTEGLPRLDVMKNLVGDPVSREEVTNALKGFSRKTPNPVYSTELKQEVEPDLQSSNAPVGVESLADDYGKQEELELELANEELYKAQARQAKAVEAMDVIILSRQANDTGRNTALDIQAYQKSQVAQREAAARRQQLMAEAIAVTKSKF